MTNPDDEKPLKGSLAKGQPSGSPSPSGPPGQPGPPWASGPADSTVVRGSTDQTPQPGAPWSPAGFDPTIPVGPPGSPGSPSAPGAPGAPGSGWPPGPPTTPAGAPGSPWADPTSVSAAGAPPWGTAAPGGTGAWPTADVPASPAPKRRRMVRSALAVVGVGAIAGLGFFIYRGLSGDSGGASSPEAAAQRLVDALNNEDPIAAAAAIDPSEVHTLGDLLSTVEHKLADAKVDESPGKAAGFDLALDDVTFRTKELGDDAVMVEITGGKATWKTDPSQAAERTKAAGLERSSGTVTRSDLVVSGENEYGSFDIDPHLVAVQRDGGWYISMSHTAASYLVEAYDLPSGDYDDEAPRDLAVADTPEQAVVDLLENAGDLDPERSLESLPVSEWGILWTYREAIEEFVDREQNGSFEVNVDDHDVDVVDLSDGYRKVVIKGAEGTVTTTDQYGDTDREDWSLDGWCMTTSDDDEESCVDEGDFLTDPTTYGIDQPFVVVAKERGGWVVSPNATLLEYGKQIADKTTNEMVYRWIGVEVVAPSEGDLTLGTPTTMTTNSGGYALYEIDLTEGQEVILGSDGGDVDVDVHLYEPGGGRRWFDGDAITIRESGTHKVAAYGYRPGEDVEVIISEVPVDTLDGNVASGTLTPQIPVRDFAFRVEADGYWTVVGDTYDVEAEIRDDSGYYCNVAWGSCELEAGRDYRLRAYTYYRIEGSEDFYFEIEQGGAATIDGATSVTGYISSSYGWEQHYVDIESGVMATITLDSDSDDADLELYCVDLDCTYDRFDDQIYVDGPASGTIEVYGYEGYGGYTLTIEVD